ncbi:hypothetical protein ACTJKC_15090 [Pedobacter sp. 22226]|uniref:hypothetical protein n=1 Tax=Pedobacter sp. 22226 TaxID=3453894 RepID=UPI003F84ED93
MSKEKSNSTSNGIGFLGLLTVAFIVLKLCNVITWSWWLVTIPIWGTVAIVAAIWLLIILASIIFT